MPTHPSPGRSLVTRRAVVDLVRTAALGSYGVTGFGGRPVERLLGRLSIHIDGLRYAPGVEPPSVVPLDPGSVGPRDLADSGTDVA